MKKIILVLFLFFGGFAIAQTAPADCERLHHCKLKYVSKDGMVDFVELNGNELFEYTEVGGPYIKASLVWNTDCEYTASITEITFKDGMLKIGDKLNCRIFKLEGTTLYMKATFKGVASDLTYEIIESL